jgi:hypothetical protein
LPLGEQLVSFLVIDDAVATRLNPFKLPHVCQESVLIYDVGNALRVVLTEIAESPVFDPLWNRLFVVCIHVVSDVKPMADGNFVRLDVADVDDPKSVSLAGTGE